jgi:hypothetical protein
MQGSTTNGSFDSMASNVEEGANEMLEEVMENCKITEQLMAQ